MSLVIEELLTQVLQCEDDVDKALSIMSTKQKKFKRSANLVPGPLNTKIRESHDFLISAGFSTPEAITETCADSLLDFVEGEVAEVSKIKHYYQYDKPGCSVVLESDFDNFEKVKWVINSTKGTGGIALKKFLGSNE